MTDRTNASLARVGFYALAMSLGLIQLSIVVAEACFDVAALVWLVLLIRERRAPDVPRFFLPLLAVAAWTLVSSAFSSDAPASWLRSRQLLLYLVVPMTVRFARGSRASTATNVIIAVGAAGALVGVVQYAALGFDTLNHRPHGLLGHYMTYAGVLMLVICTAGAQLVYQRGAWIWPAVAVPALLVALIFSQSRNAWVGALLAIVCLASLRSRKLAMAVPVLAVLFVLAAPAGIRHRALSMFDPYDPSNHDRIEMLIAGRRMIADHPLVGVGPNMVPRVYAEYRTPSAQPEAAHLHNVFVQLAAERGLPALLFWLWFVGVALRDLAARTRRGHVQALAAGGLAAVIAMLAAGLFEHNFGDSEFLILFLGLISLPFAAELADPDAAAPAVAPLVAAPVMTTRIQ